MIISSHSYINQSTITNVIFAFVEAILFMRTKKNKSICFNLLLSIYVSQATKTISIALAYRYSFASLFDKLSAGNL